MAIESLPNTASASGYITVRRKGKELAVVTLDKRNMTIGRREDCDIHLQSTSASRHHAQIFSLLKKVYVLDLDSKNGTLVNDKKIKKHCLEEGDVIKIGGHELIFSTKAPHDT